MISISHLLCGHHAGNERLRYGHVRRVHRGDGRRDDSDETPIPRPVVVWNVTRTCNLRCVHCYASANASVDADELSFDEGRALLDDLRRFGVPAVLFSGGEPLIRRDVLELIGHARSIGLNCTLSTNGVLIDSAMARRLADLGLRYVGISLDGTREMHDRLRGMRGAFDRSVEAIDHCRRHGLKVGVRFTVHALNESSLEAIFEMCRDHGVQRLCIYHLAYAGRAGAMRKVDLAAGRTRQVVDRIIELTRRFHRQGHPLEVLTVANHADAAYLLLTLEAEDPRRAVQVRELLRGTGGNQSGCAIACVDPRGNVHYDQFSWHYNCGNVRQRSFSDIWSKADDPRLAILRNRAPHLPARCRDCRFLDVCNGNLRTRAESAEGDWLGPDPSCYLTDREIGRPPQDEAGAGEMPGFGA